MPTIGELDQRILVEAPATSEDALGQIPEAWNLVGEVSAKVIETQGREFLKGDVRSERKAVFVVRWENFTSTMRVVWDDTLWRIVGATGTSRERWRYLHCVSMDGQDPEG